MIWWLLAATVAVLLLSRSRLAPIRRALRGADPLALPESATPTPLQVRMAGLDRAITEVRAATEYMSPELAQACALTAAARRGATFAGSSVSPTGPGTEVFERLLRAIDQIDEADRADLLDAGIDPGALAGTVIGRTAPHAWLQQLTQTLDFVQAGLRQLRDRRYG